MQRMPFGPWIRPAAACFLLAACGSIAGAQSGLLLGLHRADDSSEISERSLWIAPQDGKLQILELPDLIVPRKTGFWRVGTRFYCDPQDLKDEPHKEPSPDGVFFAAPVHQRPTVYGVVQCPTHVQYLDTRGTCGDQVPDGASGVAVSFVNEEYISLSDWWRTDCGGGHPDAGGKWSVERLGDPARTPIAYSDIEDKGASDEYARRAADALLDQNSGRNNADGHEVPLGEGDSQEDREIRKSFPNWSTMTDVEKVSAMETKDDQCFPKHDDKEWYIARKHGQWRAYGNFDTHRLCGVDVDFALPLHAAFAAPAAAPIDLDALKHRITVKGVSDLKSIKGVKDSFWSPDYAILVVLVNTDKACVTTPFEFCLPQELDPDDLDRTSLLQVYLPRGQDLGKPLISIPLEEFEGPVMAEWATGSNVARWTAELKEIKAQGVVKPLLSPSPHP
jgi:hypothetical protein